ncbi:MAG: lipase maturation factor family protein [Terriglobia bacterium]
MAPTLIFDGNCSFCKMWIDFWRSLTGDSVEYAPYQTALARFPEIPIEDCRKGVQWVDGAERLSGAAAVARLSEGISGYEWISRIYRVPGLGALMDLLYRMVAANRNAGYRITRALWGPRVERPSYGRASAIFSRALAFIYLIAFASFGTQVRGLIGSNGILPVSTYLQMATRELGAAAHWRLPTIFWWANSDFALLSIAWGGVALSAMAILARPHSVWQRGIFAVLFAYYLSIVSGGQIFMSYQWDLLLLECGFLVIFLKPSLVRVWLFQWLLFRLMLESGLVKLLSHDLSWHTLTALAVHYETQPLPTVPGWFAEQAPLWFHKVSAVFLFVVELGLPFLMFGPRRLKQIAAAGTITLQCLIFATGNYTFFNLLTMALCLFLLDDSFFGRREVVTAPVRSNRWVSAALFLFIMAVSSTELAAMFGPVPRELDRMVEAQASFGLVNSYGLFAAMTTTRREIEIEGSNDEVNWQPYVFRYKPGPLNRAPGWVAPFQPRLDWQMWFAALGNFRENPWLARFLLELLEGSKPVLALLERDPFGGVPPQHIRAQLYRYSFTSFGEERRTGNWWKRELLGTYLPPVSLRH